jgi:hypothetical protein
VIATLEKLKVAPGGVRGAFAANRSGRERGVKNAYGAASDRLRRLLTRHSLGVGTYEKDGEDQECTSRG